MLQSIQTALADHQGGYSFGFVEAGSRPASWNLFLLQRKRRRLAHPAVHVEDVIRQPDQAEEIHVDILLGRGDGHFVDVVDHTRPAILQILEGGSLLGFQVSSVPLPVAPALPVPA